jgi:hypothetical protein
VRKLPHLGSGFPAGGLVVLAFLGCSGHRGNGAGANEPSRTVTVHNVGEETYVSIDEAPTEPVNARCIAYCNELGTCWHAVASGDPTMQPKDVTERCLAEQNGCRTNLTDLFCCAGKDGCFEFSQCQAKGRDIATSTCRASDASSAALLKAPH